MGFINNMYLTHKILPLWHLNKSIIACFYPWSIVKSKTSKFHMFKPKCLFDRSSSTILQPLSMSTTKIIPLHACFKKQLFAFSWWQIMWNMKHKPSTFKLWRASIWKHNVFHEHGVILTLKDLHVYPKTMLQKQIVMNLVITNVEMIVTILVSRFSSKLMHLQTPWRTQMRVQKWKQQKKELGYAS
jgi:hypothetical protein